MVGKLVDSWSIQILRSQGHAFAGLIGGFKHFLFSIIYGIILPIDFHIFQRGRPTTNQWKIEQPDLSIQLSAVLYMGSPKQHMHGVVRVMFLLKPTSSGSEYHRVFTYLAGIDYLYIIYIYMI
jgi:hypothetical protein